jgi:hypothetical protein
MLHACVERFDVIDGRENILGWDGKVNKAWTCRTVLVEVGPTFCFFFKEQRPSLLCLIHSAIELGGGRWAGSLLQLSEIANRAWRLLHSSEIANRAGLVTPIEQSGGVEAAAASAGGRVGWRGCGGGRGDHRCFIYFSCCQSLFYLFLVLPVLVGNSFMMASWYC